MNAHRLVKIMLVTAVVLAVSACALPGQLADLLQGTAKSAAPVVTPTPAPSATPQPPAQTATPAPSPTATVTLRPPQPVTISAVHMLDQSAGWGVGRLNDGKNDLILFTRDGGSTWQDVSPSAAYQTDGPLADVGVMATAFFADENSVWVTFSPREYAPSSGDALVWFTRDGGATWGSSQPLQFNDLPQEFFQPGDLFFVDGQTGWLMAHLGAGMSHDYIAIFQTTDGGLNWKRLVDPDRNNLPMSCYKHGMSFLNRQTGWVSGDCYGVVAGLFFYQTNDGGQTWALVNLPDPAGQTALFRQETTANGAFAPRFSNPLDGRLVVQSSFYTNEVKIRQWLYVTADGAKTWKSYPLPTAYGEMDFVSPAYGWWLGEDSREPNSPHALYRTTDGGQTWTLLLQTEWGGVPDFVDDQTGWVAARNGDAAALVKTEDGGKKWIELKPVVQ